MSEGRELQESQLADATETAYPKNQNRQLQIIDETENNRADEDEYEEESADE